MDSTANDPLIGLILADKYKIIERIGAGGMSTVYKAEHLVMDRPVAVKILAKELAFDDLSRKRFLAEAKIASQITHPNAVTLFDAGVQEDIPYLVMEYLSGVTLKEEIKAQGPLGIERIAKIMEQVCGALSDAHNQGIVHRDLKPSNIMIMGRDRVKVLDFGIAKLLRPTANIPSELTVVGSLVGTPHYMSPEQGLSKEVTHQSDIYSLGVILYEMLSAELPFDGPSSVVILIKHANERPKPFHEIKPELAIPQPVEKIVMRCLEKEPKDRYPNVDELLSDLNTAVPRAERTSAVLELGEDEREKPGWAIGAGILAAFLAFAVAFGAFFILRPQRVMEKPSAVSAVDQATSAAEAEALRKAQEELEAARLAQEAAESAKLAAEQAAKRAQEEAEAARKSQEEAEALWQAQMAEESARKSAAEQEALLRAQAEIAKLKRAQEEAQQAKRLAEEAALKAQAEAEAAQRAQQESEAARKAAEQAEAAKRAEAEAEAKRKAQAGIEALKKAQAEAEAARRLAEEAGRKSKIEVEAAKKVESETEVIKKAQQDAESVRRALAEAEAAKKAAEAAAAKARAEAAALRRAEEAKRRAQEEAEAKESALSAIKATETKKPPEPVPQQKTAATAPPAAKSEESKSGQEERPRVRRRCGPTWCY